MTNANIKFLESLIEDMKVDDEIPSRFSVKYVKKILATAYDGKKVKREPTAYNLFVKEQMPIMKEKYPDEDYREYMTKISVLWKAKKAEMSEEEEKKEEEEEVEEEKKTKKKGKKGKKEEDDE